MSLGQVCRDESLYGHSLLALPHKIWTFSTSEFSLADRPDAGTLVVDRDYFIAKAVHYRIGNTVTYRTVLITEKPLLDLIEFVGRRILGSFTTAISFLVLAPIGFITKLHHLGARQIYICIASSPLAIKISQVWENADLFGHAFTSAPSRCYQFTTAPLGWHLRPDGTDRRS